MNIKTIAELKINRRYNGWAGNRSFDLTFTDGTACEAFMCCNELKVGDSIQVFS